MFPKLPPSPIGPLREVIRESRELIEDASGQLRNISEELRGFSQPLSKPTPTPTTEKPTTKFKVSDKDTLLYQLDHLVSVLTQLETHLSESCKIMGVPCDCCSKHALQARTFAMETIPIASRMGKETTIYQDIATWAPYIEDIDTPEKVQSGEYDEIYRQESGTASNFRKQIQALIAELKAPEEDCPGCEEFREKITEFIQSRKMERGEA